MKQKDTRLAAALILVGGGMLLRRLWSFVSAPLRPKKAKTRWWQLRKEKPTPWWKRRAKRRRR